MDGTVRRHANPGQRERSSALIGRAQDRITPSMLTPLRSLLLVGVLVAVPLEAYATLSAQPGARVQFTASGPAGMKIVGTTSDLAAADDGQNVTVTVTLANLTTAMELRDKHMREKYLEVQTYPTTVLTVPRAALSLPAAGASQAGDAQGTLTLHGQTRPASFHYSVANNAGSYQVDGKLHIVMTDYAMAVPTYAGLGVKPDVDVEVHFSTTDH